MPTLYGFHTLEDVFAEQALLYEARVIDAVQQAVAEHNRQMAALSGMFSVGVTDPTLRFKAAGNAVLQPLDEQGRPRPIRRAGEYTVGFPLQKAGGAIAQTYEARIKMSVQDVNDVLSELTIADTRWMRQHLLAALFDDAGWTFEDEQYGAINVVGLANGDATTYNISAGSDNGATDNHYFAATAVSDAVFEQIEEEITEHPENGGDIVAMIPTDLRAAVQDLAGFYSESDPNIRRGSGEAELTGSANVATPGEIIGYHDAGVWIAHWRSMPSGYIAAMATQGSRALGQREDEFAQLRGFVEEDANSDYPFLQRNFVRRAGFGANNRIGAAVYRIDASGAYAPPSGFTAPLG